MKSSVADVRLELLTLCDFALTSKEGKLSIIGMFDRIFAQKIPTTYARFFVVAVLTGQSESEHKVSLSIKDPQGNEVLSQAKEIRIKLGSQGRSNIITDITNLPLKVTGEYNVALAIAGKELGNTHLSVLNVSLKSTSKANLPN